MENFLCAYNEAGRSVGGNWREKKCLEVAVVKVNGLAKLLNVFSLCLSCSNLYSYAKEKLYLTLNRVNETPTKPK